MSNIYPSIIPNLIGGESVAAKSQKRFVKLSPHSGEQICEVVRSEISDALGAIESAKMAQRAWAAVPAVKRGEILFEIAAKMKEKQGEIASIVALETGKSLKDALGETGAAIQQAFFMAGEGQRLFGRTTTSSVANRYPLIIREPMGVAALIIAANTPIANVAWKVFPALICGNAVVLKPSEDTPITAWYFGQLASQCGLPKGVLNIVHGYGIEVGAPLVESNDIQLVSFTGSTAVGRYVAKTAGERLAKVCLELGGKNPFVVCDDANIENAVKWACLSAFSNAGQRCAAGSRILVFENIYDQFRSVFLKAVNSLKVGNADSDDFGPVINLRQLNNMVSTVERAVAGGAKIVAGGKRLQDEQHKNGYYMSPTVLEGVRPDDELSTHEIFGPITALYKVSGFQEALELSNRSAYGLTACIHTSNFHRAVEFSRKVQSGVAIINAGTFGSEPHMPFGGVKNSGNGGREPGPEAIDFYSNLKVIYENVIPEQC